MKALLSVVSVLMTLAVVRLPESRADSPRILPERITLFGADAACRLLLERVEDSIARGPRANVSWRVEDASVARIQDGRIVAVGSGTTGLEALLDGQPIARTQVTVVRGTSGREWTFRNHVEPVLTRLGCNSGACHGALAGKGGFRLSLRAYDPERDHFNITMQHLGRRIDRAEPAMSLVLTKPTTAVPHRGGRRMTVDSLHYQVLSEWIAAGAPGPSEADPRLEELTVMPDRLVLEQDSVQPLIVLARYSDGTVEDVTHWARFTSSADAVARVNADGLITVTGPGEGAVTVSFGSQIVIARMTVPFDQTVAPETFVRAPRRNVIDDIVLDHLKLLNLEPSGRSDDAVFVRRAFLDTTGVLPTADDVRAFLADDRADKRDRLIERLLHSRAFVDYWSYRWSDVLMINGNLLRQQAVKAYYEWIRHHVERNTPWDEIVRELITSRGSSLEQGATNFFALHQTPEDMAENVSQAFLGLSIGCARCHNHPLEKWTNDQYYAFANLFSRVRAKGWGGDGRSGSGQRTLITVSEGELLQPRAGKPRMPAPLDEDPVPFDDERDRREILADWLVSDSNTLFSRSVTNRIWKNFMGIGLVEQVDDMRASNPASNEALLAALAEFLVDHDYDLRALMRLILQSETYQRSSETRPGNAADTRYYARAVPRRLMAEVLLDAISQVTDVPDTFTEISYPGGDVQNTDFYEPGTRALQLYDSAVKSRFLKTFGRNQRRITCECERSNAPSLVQVLHLSNGTTLNEKLSRPENRIARWQERFGDDHAGLIEELFLATLSRFPSPDEQQALTSLLAETRPPQRREILEDILWGLLTTREFLFAH